MYAVFANIRKNNTISSIKLKKVLSSNSNFYSFDKLQAQIETDKVYTIIINKKKLKKETLNLILENANSGLYFINKIDPQRKLYQLAVPEMLIKDYEAYMKLFKNEYKLIKKDYLFYKSSITKNISKLLKKKKLTPSSLINLIMTNILDITKLPMNFTMDQLKVLNKALDNKGKKNSCLLGTDTYFSIEPNPCKTYFRFNPKSLVKNSSKKEEEVKVKINFFEKKKKKKKKRRRRRMGSSKSSSSKSSSSKSNRIIVDNIGNAMGKPKLKTPPPTVSKTELKMKLKNDKIKMRKLESKIKSDSIMNKGKIEKEMFTIKSNSKSKILNFFQSFIILLGISFFLNGTNNIMFKILQNIILFPVKLIKKLCKK